MDDVKTVPKHLEAFIVFSCDGTSVQNVPVIMHSIYVMLKVVRIVGMDETPLKGHIRSAKYSVGTNVRNIPMNVSIRSYYRSAFKAYVQGGLKIWSELFDDSKHR